jgi:hypothetical protein
LKKKTNVRRGGGRGGRREDRIRLVGSDGFRLGCLPSARGQLAPGCPDERGVRTPTLAIVSHAVPRAHARPVSARASPASREGGGGRCPAGARGGRDTHARQQKSEERDTTPDILLTHSDQHLQHMSEGR